MSDSDKLRYCIIYATFAMQFYIHYITLSARYGKRNRMQHKSERTLTTAGG